MPASSLLCRISSAEHQKMMCTTAVPVELALEFQFAPDKGPPFPSEIVRHNVHQFPRLRSLLSITFPPLRTIPESWEFRALQRPAAILVAARQPSSHAQQCTGVTVLHAPSARKWAT